MESEHHKINFDFKIRNEDLTPQNFGKVVIFEDASISSLIAVKTFYPSYDGQAYRNFDSIINSYKMLSHKLFTPIIDYTTPNQETPPQIATLFIPHKSLKDLLIEKRNGVNNALSDPNNIAKIVVGIVIGMKNLYQNGIYHLDLKPSNILIDENCNPLITDYYNQKLVHHNITIPFANKSSPYTAPDYDPLIDYNLNLPIAERDDSYSFGLILLELLSNEDIFANLKPGQIKPEIPNSINEDARSIISQCLNSKIPERLKFDVIYSKLRKINFKITNGIIPEIPISYIDSIFNHIVVKIKLLNGQICPIDVYDYDTLFDIRTKISEKTGMKIEDIILSRNGKPLYCCWNCMFLDGPCFSEFIYKLYDRDDFLRNPHFELVVNIVAQATEYPCYGFYSSFGSNIGSTNTTSFFMVPGTIQDLCEQIVSSKRSLWILKGCHFHVKYKDRILQPNESMIENHFESFSKVFVELDWNTYITINNQRIRCNLDDPVQELICRFAMKKYGKIICGLPYLHKSGVHADLDSDKTIRQHGIIENDNLNFDCQITSFKISTCCNWSSDKKTLYYEPSCSIRSLKMCILMVNKNWKSLNHFVFSPYSYLEDEDRIEDRIYGDNIIIRLIERSISEEIAGRTY